MGPHNVALPSQLPPTFTSFYRLFLRATSASVLHHPRSTRNLRRLWRPTFNGAAEVVHRLQSYRQESAEHEKLKTWLKLWDARMDSTLSMLHASSQSRGLPHRLTQNFSQLMYQNLKWTQRHYYSVSSTWRPDLDPSEYVPKPAVTTRRGRNKDEKRRRQEIFTRDAWGALGEVVRMAEGRHGVSLGRVTFNERQA